MATKQDTPEAPELLDTSGIMRAVNDVIELLNFMKQTIRDLQTERDALIEALKAALAEVDSMRRSIQ